MSEFFIGRDPDAPLRTRRALDAISAILNSLIRAGVLDVSEAGAWDMSGLFFSGNGAPASTLGFPGCHYFDKANGILYKKE